MCLCRSWMKLPTGLKHCDQNGFSRSSFRYRQLLKFPIPPIEQQANLVVEYDKQLRLTDSAMEKTESSIDRLREFRSALITTAVTGQIDVSTWGKQGTADRRLDQIEEATSP